MTTAFCPAHLVLGALCLGIFASTVQSKQHLSLGDYWSTVPRAQLNVAVPLNGLSASFRAAAAGVISSCQFQGWYEPLND